MEYLALVDTLDLKSHHSYFVTYYESKDENGDITFHGTIKNKLIKDFEAFGYHKDNCYRKKVGQNKNSVFRAWLNTY